MIQVLKVVAHTLDKFYSEEHKTVLLTNILNAFNKKNQKRTSQYQITMPIVILFLFYFLVCLPHKQLGGHYLQEATDPRLITPFRLL